MATIDGAREEAQRRLVQAIAQHSAYLHRASTAQVNRMHEVIDEMGGQLAAELSDRLDNLTPAELQAFTAGRYTTSRLKGVRNAINAWAETLGSRIDAIGKEGFEELAGHEARYMRDLMAGVIEGEAPSAPSAAAAYAAARSTPVLGEFVEGMLADLPDTTRRQVYSALRQGISQGQTTGEIVRALRGTKALNFKDGVLQTTRNSAERIVRTARGHISNVAYEETYRALDVKEVVWVAALELRTCRRCAPLDGQRYKVDEPHPRPVLHPNCRCQLAPSLDDDIMGQRPYVRAGKITGQDGNTKFRSIGNMTAKQRERAGLKVGQVKASTTYDDWFSSQPARFQKEWLGPKRYKLYKEGGYKLDRFTDPRQREYTLEELAAQDRETWNELFG